MADLASSSIAATVPQFYGVLVLFNTAGSITDDIITRAMEIWQCEAAAVDSDSVIAAATRLEPGTHCYD